MRLLAADHDLVAQPTPRPGESPGVDVRAAALEEIAVPDQDAHRIRVREGRLRRPESRREGAGSQPAPSSSGAGVGYARTPPWSLHPGDVVEVGVERLGVLRDSVVGNDARVVRHDSAGFLTTVGPVRGSSPAYGTVSLSPLTSADGPVHFTVNARPPTGV